MLISVLASVLSGHTLIEPALVGVHPASVSAAAELGVDANALGSSQEKATATAAVNSCDTLAQSSSSPSTLDCTPAPTITADYSIIRPGYPVVISWDPRGNTNCMLSLNLLNLQPTPNGKILGSIHDMPTAETSYSIVCDGIGKQSSVTVNVLPNLSQ